MIVLYIMEKKKTKLKDLWEDKASTDDNNILILRSITFWFGACNEYKFIYIYAFVVFLAAAARFRNPHRVLVPSSKRENSLRLINSPQRVNTRRIFFHT